MRVLNIVTSPRKDQSVSRRLVDAFLREYMRQADDIVVDTLDVWQEWLPEFDAETINVKYKGVLGEPMTPAEVTEAAVHRVAVIRPQFEHKPTWHGLVNVRLHPRHPSLVGSGRRGRSGSLARFTAIRAPLCSAAGGLNGRFFGHSALLLPLALCLAGALPLIASARRVPGAACLRRYWRIVLAASFNCCRRKPLGTSPLSTQASIRLNRSSSCSSR